MGAGMVGTGEGLGDGRGEATLWRGAFMDEYGFGLELLVLPEGLGVIPAFLPCSEGSDAAYAVKGFRNMLLLFCGV